MIFHQGQQTNQNQARELYTKCTFTRKKQQQELQKGKTWEICFSDKKKGKRKFLHANYLKYRDNFNITPTGVGLLPTHHDKNNERSSGIRPFGL